MAYHQSTNKICNVCRFLKIGDEFHVILQCRSLDNDGKPYLSMCVYQHKMDPL